VAHRIYAPMNPVQAARGEAVVDRVFPKPQLKELEPGNHTVLHASEPRYRPPHFARPHRPAHIAGWRRLGRHATRVRGGGARVARASCQLRPGRRAELGSGGVSMLGADGERRDEMNGTGEGQALLSVLRGSAVPYGYTLTVLSSHSILADRHGGPDVVQVGCFVIGAMLGFAALALLAQRRPQRSRRPVQPDQGSLIRAGMSHVFAIGAAFGATVLISLIPGLAAWPLGAFAATVLYLLITSIEIDVATRETGERAEAG
jgi:hypothetical protein